MQNFQESDLNIFLFHKPLFYDISGTVFVHFVMNIILYNANYEYCIIFKTKNFFKLFFSFQIFVINKNVVTEFYCKCSLKEYDFFSEIILWEGDKYSYFIIYWHISFSDVHRR